MALAKGDAMPDPPRDPLQLREELRRVDRAVFGKQPDDDQVVLPERVLQGLQGLDVWVVLREVRVGIDLDAERRELRRPEGRDGEHHDQHQHAMADDPIDVALERAQTHTTIRAFFCLGFGRRVKDRRRMAMPPGRCYARRANGGRMGRREEGGMRRMLMLMLALAGVLVAAIAHAGFSPEVVAALETSKDLYVATKRADGSLSKVVPVWFMYDGDAIYFTTLPTTYKAKRIRKGSPLYVWVGRADGPHFVGAAEVLTDPALAARMAPVYAK
jgi:hypothetical protein